MPGNSGASGRDKPKKCKKNARGEKFLEKAGASQALDYQPLTKWCTPWDSNPEPSVQGKWFPLVPNGVIYEGARICSDLQLLHSCYTVHR